MYLEHFKLRAAPFAISPDPRFFYKGGKYKKVQSILIDRLSKGGLCVLTGRKGIGKSSVILQVKRHMGREYKVVTLSRPDMIPENLLNYLLFELKLTDALVELQEAELRLKSWLAKEAASPSGYHRLIIVIENAQKLPLASLQALESLAELPVAEGNLFSVLLSGNASLQEQVKETHSPSISGVYELPPLTKKEVGEYLNFRAREVGYFPGDTLFDHAVSNRIAKLSEGVPRNIHLLADKVLCAAFNLNEPMPLADHLLDVPSPDEKAVDDSAAEDTHVERYIAAACVLLSLVLYFTEPGKQQGAAEEEPVQLAESEVVEITKTAPVVTQVIAEEVLPEPVVALQEIEVEVIEVADAEQQAALDVPKVTVEYSDDSTTNMQEQVEERDEATQTLVEEALELIPELVVVQPQRTLSTLGRSQQNLMNWLLDAPATAATIQLLLVKGGEGSKVAEYLKELSQDLPMEELMTYTTVRDNKPYYGILYRQFENRNQAFRAKQQLPANVARLGPFITRTAKGIEDEQGQI